MNVRSHAIWYPHDEATIIRCVAAMAEAQDRMHYVAPEPYVRRTVTPAVRLVNISGDASDFTPYERAMFRALALKFPPEKCVEMVLRARSGGGA